MPPSSLVARDDFIDMALHSGCSDISNRLYVIDDAQVFWDVKGRCGDGAFGHTLFGSRPQLTLCSDLDSIMGTQTGCDDERYRDMFDTILKNLAQADLGLGASHKVEWLTLAGEGDALAIHPVLEDQNSGVAEAQNVVVRDLKTWQALWIRINGNRSELPPLPQIDFAKHMVVGVFGGSQPDGCGAVQIVRTFIADGALRVEYRRNQAQTLVACPTAPTTPASVALLERVERKVVFEEIKPSYQTYRRIDIGHPQDRWERPFTAVLKDQASLEALWARQAQTDMPVPSVDFSKSMLIFASSGCYANQVTDYYRSGGKLYVESLNRTLMPTEPCFTRFIDARALIEVERSDDAVVFAERIVPL